MSRFLGLGNGKDGVIALGSYTPLKYTCSGASGASSLTATGTFSPGDRLFIHQSRGTGAGAYEDNRVASYTTGTITLVHPLENTYTDSGASQAQVLVVKEASSVTGTITVPAWDGDVGGVFAIACNGTFSGTVDATGKGYRGGRSGANPIIENQDGEQGEGYAGAQSRTYTANGNGGGGGQERTTNEQGNGGGGGGHASAGIAGNGSGPGQVGAAGAAVGSADLTSLFLGGGGGGGGFGDSEGTDVNRGNGGAGGGIIVIYAKNVSSSASLIADGVAGQDGNNDRGAGGGGAGGSILIKTISTSVGTITGLGTSAAGGTSGGGGNGSVGRIRIESCSLSGTTNPTASTQTGGHSYCGSLAAIL